MTVQDAPELDFNPMISPHREDPHLFYAAARAQPVAFSPSIGAFMVTRYEDLVTVLADPETYSSAIALPSIWANPPEVVAELEGCVAEGSTLVNADSPAHLPIRRVVDHAFSGRRIRAVLPQLRDRANELIDAFGSEGHADLLAQYAAPFVQTAIGLVMGLPIEDTERVQGWTDDYVLLWNPLAPVDGKVDAARRLVEYERYIGELIEARRAEPRDDLISDMVHGADGFPPLSYADMQYLVRGFRVAGYDTTRDTITSTLLLMLSDRGHWERATAEPSRLIPKMVEETLRRDAPHRGLMRLTTREVELGGTLLPAGSPMLLLFGSGNRDETVFGEPDAVRLDRPNVREHLAFGQGMHVCPGAQLARTEIRVAVETLTHRLPDLRLADGYEPTYIASYFFRGLEELRVTW
jgi:cytochrome P450